jgi:hypothetical protein
LWYAVQAKNVCTSSVSFHCHGSNPYNLSFTQLQISESLTSNPSVYKKIATVCFTSIGRLVAPAAQAARDDQVTKHRRLLYQATASSLSDPSALVYSLLSDVIQTLEMDDSIAADDILYLTNQTKMVRKCLIKYIHNCSTLSCPDRFHLLIQDVSNCFFITRTLYQRKKT